MSPERAAEISNEILGGVQQPNGAPTPHEPVVEGTPPVGPVATEDATDDGGSRTPKWLKAMPDEVQALVGNLSEDAQKYLRENAESGLRLKDYYGKTSELARERQELEILRESKNALDRIAENPELALHLFGDGKKPVTTADAGKREAELRRKLHETSDTDEFDKTFDELLKIRDERLKTEVSQSIEQRMSSTAEAKATRVNEAALAVRQQYGDSVDDDVWQQACQGYEQQCKDAGLDWRDTDPRALPFLLSPHVTYAMNARRVTNGQPQSHPGARAASVMSTATSQPLGVRQPWDVEKRQPTDDEMFQLTMQKFGLAGENDLAKLRANS
jgi:hypothetical protein